MALVCAEKEIPTNRIRNPNQSAGKMRLLKKVPFEERRRTTRPAPLYSAAVLPALPAPKRCSI